MQKCLYWSCRKQIPRTRWKTNVELSPVWYWIQLEFEASHLMTWSVGALFCSRKLIRWLNSWLNRQIKTEATRSTLLLKTFTFTPASYAKVKDNKMCSNYSRRWLRNWIGWTWQCTHSRVWKNSAPLTNMLSSRSRQCTPHMPRCRSYSHGGKSVFHHESTRDERNQWAITP